MLGDDIKVTILEVDGDRVKIGIEAPQAMKILRAELLAEVRDVNREAIQTSLGFMQAMFDPAVTSKADAGPTETNK